MGATLRSLKQESGIHEAVLVSTCNRFEAYMHSPGGAATRAAVQKLFRDTPVYEFADAAVVRHLFRVASGLDSMVLGEYEILRQVKQAYCAAQDGGTTGKLMNVMFQRALYVGKRVRSETAICQGSGSVAGLAVKMAEHAVGDLTESGVMILGAGEMAELTARHLTARKVRSIIVSNRTYDRACVLAAQFGGVALRFEEGLKQMAGADIVVCSTAAPHPIIRAELAREVMEMRRGRPLVFIDIAVPRDVHPEVRNVAGVIVYDLDDLQSIVDQQHDRQEREADAAEAIVEQEAREFQFWLADFRNSRSRSLRHFCPIPVKA
jgi:glutamyl-tRNA reductase